jgi:Thyroglobulin type-1 repeat
VQEVNKLGYNLTTLLHRIWQSAENCGVRYWDPVCNADSGTYHPVQIKTKADFRWCSAPNGKAIQYIWVSTFPLTRKLFTTILLNKLLINRFDFQKRLWVNALPFYFRKRLLSKNFCRLFFIHTVTLLKCSLSQVQYSIVPWNWVTPSGFR